MSEIIRISDNAIFAFTKYRSELKLINKNFESHIMLAVSQVNGCRICSYVHTKHALQTGTSNEALAQLLVGDLDAVDEDEAAALLFAQHYADEQGEYSAEAFQKIIDYYGTDKAYGILATIKIIMFGNALGITQGFFTDRFKGNRNPESRLWKEIIILLSPIIIIPIMLLRNLFRNKIRD